MVDALRIADPEWLRQQASIVDGTARLIRNYYNPDAWEPTPGSPGAADFATSVQGVDGPWGGEPIRNVVSYVALMTYAAADHLYSLGALMRQHPPALYGCVTTGRAVAEATAKVFWLLEPEISVNERVGRQLRFRISALEGQRRQIADALEVTEGHEPPEYDQHLQTILLQSVERIESARLDVTRLDVELPPEPKLGTLIAAVLDEGGEGFDIGKTVYGWLSDISHSRPTALMQSMRGAVPGGGVLPIPTADFYEVSSAVALFSIIGMVDRLVTYFGWDAATWQSWRLHMLKKWLRARQQSAERYSMIEAAWLSDTEAR
jgi:hypothetical protein